jgi:hypothetical protein
MCDQWNELAIQRYIDEQIEESLNLDYKAADALVKTDGKKKEITKDVSAMANSDGGVIIYGIREYQEADRKHLPEQIDPIDQTEFSKEWLEQVINNIRPRIDGVIICPVQMSTATNHVAYVVEIPQSTTAHQARDFRYYKRFNFESVPMEDYEIRDIMNRLKTPDVQIEFGFERLEIRSDLHRYKLSIVVSNNGSQVVHNFKLRFTFPGFIEMPQRENLEVLALSGMGVTIDTTPDRNYLVVYQSQEILFPQDTINVGETIDLEYHFNNRVYSRVTSPRPGDKISLEWVLYADNMPPKQGEIPLSQLNIY